MPFHAKGIHKAQIDNVVQSALNEAKVTVNVSNQSILLYHRTDIT